MLKDEINDLHGTAYRSDHLRKIREENLCNILSVVRSLPESTISPRSGVFYALAAYFVWGFFPLYFKAVAHVAPLEVLCHRIVWSLVVVIFILASKRHFGVLWDAIRQPRSLALLSATTLLITCNWLVFIIAIERGEVLQSSLGYFINPIVSVLLGFVFLGERLTTRQWGSVFLAAIGVAFLAFHAGKLPWISLVLACSFALYGLLRKTAAVGPLEGLAVETLLAFPLAILYLVYRMAEGKGAFLGGSLRDDFLLPLAGVVTALPLLWFAAAARQLRLSTIGLMQYITPSLHFLLAVWLFGEQFTLIHLVSFAFIWCGLAIFTIEAFGRFSARRS